MSLPEARAIIAALRQGLVPSAGLEHYAVGMEKLAERVLEELSEVAAGQVKGSSKWIRGEYGSGKTFATRYLCAKARQAGFATAEVQISINDTPLHHLQTVYRRLMERLTTAEFGAGALKAVVDEWLYELGEQVSRLKGLDEEDPEFQAAVVERLELLLSEITAQNPAFATVLRAYYHATEAGDFGQAQGLLGWLAGQPHIARSVVSKAGVKGSVDGQAALAFLRGWLTLLKQSGYKGLVIVLDEVETIQRMPSHTREKSLNALRQLMDMLSNGELPGAYLVVTGTPDFYEGHRGLRGLAPLYQRVNTKFGDDPALDNLRAPQVRLTAFDRERLAEVGKKVRDLYPAKEAERVAAKVDDAFIGALVQDVTTAFGGQVDVGPRVFLRELVDVMDRVDQHKGFDPASQYQLEIDEDALSAQELAVRMEARGRGRGIGRDAERSAEGESRPKPRRLE